MLPAASSFEIVMFIWAIWVPNELAWVSVSETFWLVCDWSVDICDERLVNPSARLAADCASACRVPMSSGLFERFCHADQ